MIDTVSSLTIYKRMPILTASARATALSLKTTFVATLPRR